MINRTPRLAASMMLRHLLALTFIVAMQLSSSTPNSGDPCMPFSPQMGCGCSIQKMKNSGEELQSIHDDDVPGVLRLRGGAESRKDKMRRKKEEEQLIPLSEEELEFTEFPLTKGLEYVDQAASGNLTEKTEEEELREVLETLGPGPIGYTQPVDPEKILPESDLSKFITVTVRKHFESTYYGDPDAEKKVEAAMRDWPLLTGPETAVKQGLGAALVDDVVELQRLLKETDLHVNASVEGFSLIHYAAAHGSVKVLCYLIQAGVDLEPRTKNGWTPLHFASFLGHPLVVEVKCCVILEHLHSQPWLVVCLESQTNFVQVLLRSGANPNVYDQWRGNVKREVRKRMEDMGFSPLTLARKSMMRSGHPDHYLYDPRGGDVFWRIEHMLFAFGAKEFIPSIPGRWGQSVRFAMDDSDLEKGLLGIPPTEDEKDWLCPWRTHPLEKKYRGWMEQGIDPNNTTFFDEVDGITAEDRDRGERLERTRRSGKKESRSHRDLRKKPKLEL